MKDLRFTDKTAIITGARQGIGRRIAVSLGEQGCRLVIADIAIGQEDEVCAELRELGAEYLCAACDVADENAVKGMFAAATERFGQLDILINNAGITRDAMTRKMSYEQFRAVIDVNLCGSFLCAREALTAMRANGGSIVNISSLAGAAGNMGQANYSSAKAGILGLTKTLALEGARDNIRVNAVIPGFIDTPMTQAMPEANRLAAIGRIPLGRAGTPDDVANAVLFLASGLSSFITGQTIHINGGRYM